MNAGRQIVLMLFLSLFSGQLCWSTDPSLPQNLKLSGTFALGYYQADNQNGAREQQNALVNSLKLNLSGYFHHPNFLRFEFKPQGTLGRQVGDIGLSDGNGFAASATVLGGSRFPLTINYNRITRGLTTFTTTSRLAGLQADTSQHSLAIDWRLRLPKMPKIHIGYAKYSDEYQPLAQITSSVDNRARLFTVDSQGKRWGWNLDTQYRLERSNTDLINLFDNSQAPFLFSRNVHEFRATVGREFGKWLQLSVNSGHSSSRNKVAESPLDQDFTYVNGGGSFRAGKKLTGNFHAGVTSNSVGFQLEQILQNQAAANPLSLSLLNSRSTVLTFSGQTQYALSHDFQLNAQLSHDRTSSPTVPTILNPNTTLTNAQFGISHFHDFRGTQWRGSYSVNLGTLDYGQHQPSRAFGHVGSAGIFLPSFHSLELGATMQGSIQHTKNGFTVDSSAFGGGLTAQRRITSNWALRASYNRDKSVFESNGTRFDSLNQGFTIGADHRRINISYNRQVNNGISLQPSLFVNPGAGPGVPSQPQIFSILPTNFSWSGLVATGNPYRNMTARFAWGRNLQQLGDRSRNHFTQWEANLGYRFRLVTVDVGYINHQQGFGLEEFGRKRFFLRLSRDFRVF